MAAEKHDQTRAAKTMIVQKQSEELWHMREEAKKKAEEIKKRHGDAKKPVTDPLHLATLANLPAVSELADDARPRGSSRTARARSFGAATGSNAPAQKALATWGSSYVQEGQAAR